MCVRDLCLVILGDLILRLWSDPMGIKTMFTASTEKKSVKKKLSKVDAKLSKATEPLKKSKLQIEKAQLQGALKVADSKLKKKQTTRDSSKKKQITEKELSKVDVQLAKESDRLKKSKLETKKARLQVALLIEGKKSVIPDLNKKKSIKKKLSKVDAKLSKATEPVRRSKLQREKADLEKALRIEEETQAANERNFKFNKKRRSFKSDDQADQSHVFV